MDWVDRLRLAVEAKGKHSAVAAEAGIDPSALSDILRRETSDPRLQTLVRICQACGVTVGWVLGEKGFELSDADYALLEKIAAWATEKIDERRNAPESPLTPTTKSVLEFPAVATPRGETWDEDELRDREIPRDFQNAGANAVFRTRGDSMINAGILEGDILFVRKTRNHRFANGRIVVCRLNGTFTVKRLQMTNDAIHLISEKTGERVVIVNEDAESFSLIGVVVGMSRDFTKRA